jgi:hypothetical protein
MVSQEHHKSHLIININKSRGFKKFNILKKSAQMVLKLRLPLLKQSAKNQPINSVKVICDHAGIQDMGSALLIGSTEKHMNLQGIVLAQYLDGFMWEMIGRGWRGRDGGEPLLEKRCCGRRASPSRAWSTPLHRAPPVASRRPAAGGGD